MPTSATAPGAGIAPKVNTTLDVALPALMKSDSKV